MKRCPHNVLIDLCCTDCLLKEIAVLKRENLRLSKAGNVDLTEFELYKSIIDILKKDNARLLSGDFTPEEFQNLCHKFQDKDKCAFFDGCEAYQKKLFGESDRERLLESVRILAKELSDVNREKAKLIDIVIKLSIELDLINSAYRYCEAHIFPNQDKYREKSVKEALEASDFY